MTGDTTTIFFRNIDGKVTVYSNTGEVKQLKSHIFEKTGIPPEFQRLYFRCKLLTDGTNLAKDVPCGCNLNLLVNLRGGGNNCEICFEKGECQCIECNRKMFCSDCSIKYHKHPSRSSHKRIIVLSSDQLQIYPKVLITVKHQCTMTMMMITIYLKTITPGLSSILVIHQTLVNFFKKHQW